MPFSLGRSYDDLPAADSDASDDRELAVSNNEPAAEIRAAPRSPRYWMAVLIIGVVAIGLCLIGLGLKRIAREAPFPTSRAPDAQTAPASATQTATDGQVAASEDAVPSPAPTWISTGTPVPSHTAPAAAVNPWSADIPEAACIPADLPQTGRVVEVLDAHTIRVLMDRDGHIYSVHYLGVGPGEGNALLARLALARNTELVYRKRAVLVRDISDADLSGSLLRYVMVDNVFVNQAIIAEGWAQVVMSSPDTACQQAFLAAQQQAQREARGLWGAGTTATATP